MSTCCVDTCKNNKYNTRNTVPKVKFFRLRENWANFCKILEGTNISNLRICSCHFKQSDHINCDPTQDIRHNVVPSVRLSTKIPNPRYRTKTKKSLLKNANKQHEKKSNIFKKELLKSQNKMEKMKLENARLESKLDQMNAKYNDLKAKFTSVSKIFTPTQLDVLTKNKTKTWWPEDDVVRALALRMKSKSAYQFVRKCWKIPLPSLSTIGRHLVKIPFNPGLIKPTINLIREYFADADDRKRQAVLIHDEININAVMSFDPGSERILGPCSNASVIVVRGLYSSWKFPIYYDYDKKYTTSEFEEIVRELELVGVKIVAITCDNSGTNIGLWNRLGVNFQNNSFTNPANNEPIYCIADPPHLIKLLRNNLLDHGFILKDKSVITKEVFEKLWTHLQHEELNICPKLTERHLTVQQSDRQKVRLACQLISRSVAAAIRTCFDKNDQYKRIADFIELCNDAYDLLNSRDPKAKSTFKKPYGMQLNEQNELLDKFYDEILYMRVFEGKGTKFYPFQKGFLMSINSLRQLYQSQMLRWNITYILTHRLNQDVLENCFGMIRGIGGFKVNPNATDFKYRLRMLTIVWHLKTTLNDSDNTAEEDSPPINVLKALKIVGNPEEVQLSTVMEQELEEVQRAEDDIVEQSDFASAVASQNIGRIAQIGGQEYMLGFILRKFKLKFPQFVNNQTNQHPLSYVQGISQGNLTVPTCEILTKFKKWEKIFINHHNGEDIRWRVNRSCQVIEILTEKLVKMDPEVPRTILRYYSKIRTFVRINYINKKLELYRARKRNARKRTQFSHSHVPDPEVALREDDEDEQSIPESNELLLDHDYI